MDYESFIQDKESYTVGQGFAPVFESPAAFDFQRSLIEFAVRQGRAAIFADCGLGKTLVELVWAENIRQATGRQVLILAPLAVSVQHVREAEKFGVELEASRDGQHTCPLAVTNYERLHFFDASRYAGIVCDESSILKNCQGHRRREITRFMKHIPYRLLCTATAAPNDYHELGTSSEALSVLGYLDMLDRFFKKEEKHTLRRFRGGDRFESGWRFKGHAEIPFWRWVASWARSARSPADLGFDDSSFTLPPLHEHLHAVETLKPRPGMLLDIPASGLAEQRAERRHSIRERCEKVAALAGECDSAIIWCHMNDEANLVENLIGADAVQVAGSDSIEAKEERLLGFADGKIRYLVTKPRIAGFGLNLQRHANVILFPSHSYEQYYQAIRRCWRFGQTRPVNVHIVHTPGETKVMASLRRKKAQAEKMFESIVQEMSRAMSVTPRSRNGARPEMPPWIR